MLLRTAANWLEEQGMEAMDGPINFGERDKFWGLTIDGFEHSPYYGQAYSPAYYLPMFTHFGLQEYYKQLLYHRRVGDKLQEKFEERAIRLMRDPEYTVRKINKGDLDTLTREFRHVYNRAWGKREGDDFKGLNEAQAKAITHSLKPILDENLAYFAYYKDQPIGFYIAIPELNEIFKKFNGKFGLWEKLKFLVQFKLKRPKRSVGLVFGVDPAYQGKGVEGLIFKKNSEDLIRAGHYEDVIISWLGDFNGKMINIVESLGATIRQQMATFRYGFKQDYEFERYKIKH